MARGPRNVDLGPMYLPLGEGPELPAWNPRGVVATAIDAVRFESLMTGPNERQHDQIDLPEEETPVSALSPYADAEQLSDQIEHLWVGSGIHSAREVRIGLREELLPDTSVRLYQCEGSLRIDFTCGAHRSALWLQNKVPALIKDIGLRLNTSIQVLVYAGDGSVVTQAEWKGAPL